MTWMIETFQRALDRYVKVSKCVNDLSFNGRPIARGLDLCNRFNNLKSTALCRLPWWPACDCGYTFVLCPSAWHQRLPIGCPPWRRTTSTSWGGRAAVQGRQLGWCTACPARPGRGWGSDRGRTGRRPPVRRTSRKVSSAVCRPVEDFDSKVLLTQVNYAWNAVLPLHVTFDIIWRNNFGSGRCLIGNYCWACVSQRSYACIRVCAYITIMRVKNFAPTVAIVIIILILIIIIIIIIIINI